MPLMTRVKPQSPDLVEIGCRAEDAHAGLARKSHKRRCIEDLIGSKLLCRNDLAQARGPCRKLWRRPQDGRDRPRLSHFVNLRETEAECQQLVLFAHRPRARKAEALAEPQHRLEALDGAPGCVEGLKAADPRHGPFDPEVV